VLAIAGGEESSPTRLKTALAALVRCGKCTGRKRTMRGLTTDENKDGKTAERRDPSSAARARVTGGAELDWRRCFAIE
jgi:hypothetical protein